MRKLLFAFLLVMFAASSVYAAPTYQGYALEVLSPKSGPHPLDSLKTTWEQSMERATEANRLNASWSPVWSRMERTIVGTGTTGTQTELPAGFNPNGEILPFVKEVARQSGGRVRYEVAGYSYHGVEIPLSIVGFPKAPRNPSEIGDRIVIYWNCSIHGAENDGAEAALIFVREAAQGKWDDILKDAVVLIVHAANPDGKNAQARYLVDPYVGTGPTSTQGLDPNRAWSKAHASEVRAGLRLFRLWDPHIIIDHHNIGSSGIRYPRHIVTYANGKWGSNDPDTVQEALSFSEGMFGQGVGKYKVAQSFYTTYLGNLIDAYSPNNTYGNQQLYSLSHSFANETNNSFSPERNKSLSLVSMPYTETFTPGIVDGNHEVVAMPNPLGDSNRGMITAPQGKNRISILMEIVSSHHTWLKVNAQYASVVSTIDLCQQRKNDVFEFFRRKNSEYAGLNNNSPEQLRTVYLGNLDYRNDGNASGGNEQDTRKTMPIGYDMGYGPDIFRLEAYKMTAANQIERWTDYTHHPKILLSNLPQWPMRMGAFYILDPRATEAAQVLMRQGIEVYKLKVDVTLPNGQTQKVYGPNRSENWGVTKNRTPFIGVLTTKLPRPRAEIIDSYSTEANKITLDYSRTNAEGVAGVPFEPLAPAAYPKQEDWPHEDGGGDWMNTPADYVAKAGYYVIPIAQKWAKYAAFQLEPRSNCGLLFWAHYDSAVGGTSRGDEPSIVNNFNIDLVKTFDFTAITASALRRLYLPEDPVDSNMNINDLPAPPSNVKTLLEIAGLNAKDSAVSSIEDDDEANRVTFIIKDTTGKMSHGMTLVFYFYPITGSGSDSIVVVASAFDAEASGAFEVNFSHEKLKASGLLPDAIYYFAFADLVTDDAGDYHIGENVSLWGKDFGYLIKDDDDDDDDIFKGCNAGYATAFIFLVSLFVIKRK